MQISPYFILVCVLAAVILFTIFATRKNMNKRAAKEVFAALVLAFFALVFFGLSLLILDERLRFILHEMKFIPLAFLAPCSLMVYCAFSGRALSINKRLLICVIPMLAVVAAQTNGLHHIFRSEMYVLVHDGISYVGVVSAWGYWVHLVYGYTLYIIGICILVADYFKKPRIYRDQTGFMIMTALVALVVCFAVVAGHIPDYGDISLVTWAVVTIVQYITIVNYSYKRVLIEANHLVVSGLDSLVMIFDHRDRLVDANKDASRFTSMIKSGDDYLSDMDESMDNTVIAFPESNDYFSINEKRLYDQKEKYMGRVLVIKDVSGLEVAVRELEHITTHDYLTGLPNRLVFRRELQQLGTQDCPAALICINIAGMKLINNIFGNEYGDRVIICTAKELERLTEKGNACMHLGGDEMGVILRNTERPKVKAFISILKECLENAEDMIGISIAADFVMMINPGQNAGKLFANMVASMRKNDGTLMRSVSKGFMASLERSLMLLHDSTGERLQKIIDLSMRTADQLALSAEEKERLRLLSVMMDISLLGVSTAILANKNDLSNEQWSEWKLHPVKGHNIARSIQELSGIADEILAHHERYDGYGYPMRMKGEDIPLLARIIAAVEFFIDTPGAKASEMLRARSGTQFDPKVVDAILSILSEHDEAVQSK